jgi:metacaspase-1
MYSSHISPLTLKGADGLQKEPNIVHEAGRGLLNAFTDYKSGNIEQALTEGASILKIVTRTKESREQSRRTRTSPSDSIQFSGCKNYQTSADTTEGVHSILPLHANDRGVQQGR